MPPAAAVPLPHHTGRKSAVCLSICRSAIPCIRPRIVKGLGNIKNFLVEHNNETFLFVCILVLLGTLFSLFPPPYTPSQPVEFFLLILFSGILLCWVAVCWWTQRSFYLLEDSNNQSSENSPPSEIILEKPPEYESLVPLTSDMELPAYEDVILPDGDLKRLLPCSVAVKHEVPLCEVHLSRGVGHLSPGGSIH